MSPLSAFTFSPPFSPSSEVALSPSAWLSSLPLSGVFGLLTPSSSLRRPSGPYKPEVPDSSERVAQLRRNSLPLITRHCQVKGYRRQYPTGVSNTTSIQLRSLISTTSSYCCNRTVTSLRFILISCHIKATTYGMYYKMFVR